MIIAANFNHRVRTGESAAGWSSYALEKLRACGAGTKRSSGFKPGS